MYDRYLSLLPNPPVRDDIVIVGIDDRAIDLVGSWPWGRDEVAAGIIAMSEFGVADTLLDIEFSEDSPLLVDRGVLERMGVDTPIIARDIVVDRDEVLSEAVAALGNVYLPLVIDPNRPGGVRRPIASLENAAAGLGFSNIVIDRDGVTRRVKLIESTEDESYLQLAFRFQGLTPESIEIGRGYATMPAVGTGASEGEARGETRRFPVGPDGTVRIPWHNRPLEASFDHISWATISEYVGAMDDLRYNLTLMDEAGFVTEERRSVVATADAADEARAIALREGDSRRLDEYRELRRAFVALAGGYLESPAEREILDELARFLSEDTPEEVRREVEAIVSDVEAIFAETRDIYAEVIRLRRFLEVALEDRDVLVGYTATSTTDLGVTPFDEAFANIGVHAIVLDTIRRGSFVAVMPRIVVAGIAILVSIALSYALHRRSGTPALVLALGVLLLVPITGILVFTLSRTYLPVLHAIVPIFLSANGVLGLRFVQTAREKGVIRSAFEYYLAPEVINQLLEDPSKVHVGGTEENLTVLFTDIESFSRVSEQLTPVQLVDLLNEYLTDMTGVIVGQGGTIDKFEGDAIMSFFGAPVFHGDHPARAAVAAIQMKKLERLLNDRLITEGRSPAPLITRIGINTGPMIVGNLGTSHRLNYTVMGGSVNLASRLESVNKLYGTHICVSHWTREALDERFLLRRLDRVRVKGIDEEVRLYELIGYQTESTAPLREALELFENGMNDFEQREWERAERWFSTVLRIYPNDGPAERFARLTKEYLSAPPRESWDGVTMLESK